MIKFETYNVEMPALNQEFLCRWIEAVCASLNRRPGRIIYRFCDDSYILDVNRQFLGHDYFTDIITFDYSRGEVVAGDILISLDTVTSNAEEIGTSATRELLRVIIHGVLHLCGINDKGPGEREIMEQHENRALDIYDTLLTDSDR